MPVETSDVRSNPNDQIAHAARVVGRSPTRRAVFAEIHRGKKRVKRVSEIVTRTGLNRIRVLQEARKLVNNRLVKELKLDGETAYEKDDFYAQNKDKILKLAGNRKALERFPTKINPLPGIVQVNFPAPEKMIDVEHLSIDDIDSFDRVRNTPFSPVKKGLQPSEDAFKQGLKRILSEEGAFKDWGGEQNDLFTTRMVLGGKRLSAAFGLKGPGTKGKLTPKKMGTNGDQIQRLFKGAADIFLIQYWDQIDQTVLEQMKALAVAKSVIEQRKIYYGVIDGQDTLRILQAYPESFAEKRASTNTATDEEKRSDSDAEGKQVSQF